MLQVYVLNKCFFYFLNDAFLFIICAFRVGGLSLQCLHVRDVGFVKVRGVKL